MLVCNVSLRPPRRAIAAGIAESAAAVDAIATGNIVFATLVDDPGLANAIVDAYLGSIMLEAASAADAVDVVQTYSATADEPATAVDAPDATIAGAVVSREAMAAGPMPVFVNSDSSREAYVDGVMINQ